MMDPYMVGTGVDYCEELTTACRLAGEYLRALPEGAESSWKLASENLALSALWDTADAAALAVLYGLFVSEQGDPDWDYGGYKAPAEVTPQYVADVLQAAPVTPERLQAVLGKRWARVVDGVRTVCGLPESAHQEVSRMVADLPEAALEALSDRLRKDSAALPMELARPEGMVMAMAEVMSQRLGDNGAASEVGDAWGFREETYLYTGDLMALLVPEDIRGQLAVQALRRWACPPLREAASETLWRT